MNRYRMNPCVRMLYLGLHVAILIGRPFCSVAAPSFEFSNTNAIGIPSIDPPTPALPYPSAILVTGTEGQTVVKATVTLNGFTHQSPSDVTMLLVAPQGQNAIIMSEVGGQDRFPVSNLTLTLDDDSTNQLPIFTSLYSGTFQPTNGYLALNHASLPYDLPLPAPPDNSNSVCTLSVFSNSDPTGIWNLFVVDDANPWSGIISNGWTLTLTLAVPLNIVADGTNVVISWPVSATNAVLESCSSLFGSPGWSAITNPPQSNPSTWTVTNPIAGDRVYYRLVTP